jgi:hypothetical protein
METKYFDNEGLPYALFADKNRSFLMRGDSKADWFRINSSVAAKVEMNGSPISEENALDMAGELSVPEEEV